MDHHARDRRRRRSPGGGQQRRPVTAKIADEIHTALERLDADAELLAIVGSWGDTLEDADVLALLRDYNATGKTLHRPQ